MTEFGYLLSSEEQARKAAHRPWASDGVPGESSRELSMPVHFEQAAELVSPDDMANTIPCGPDPDRHVEGITAFTDAGYDEVHLSQVGDDPQGFFDLFTNDLASRL